MKVPPSQNSLRMLLMRNKSSYSRKANLSMVISEFELPPMQDLLIIGKQAPVGPEAVMRMAEALSPEQFTVLKIDHPKVEGILIRRSLLEMMDQQLLLEIIMEEADCMVNECMVLRAELKFTMFVEREVELN
jgi:hypothetical protein